VVCPRRARSARCLIASLAALARRGSRFGSRLRRRRSGTERRVSSLLLSTAARDPGLIASLAALAVFDGSRARCDVRWQAAVFVGSDERLSRGVSSLSVGSWLLLQSGGANIARGSRFGGMRSGFDCLASTLDGRSVDCSGCHHPSGDGKHGSFCFEMHSFAVVR
jgi:hypothetical protein